MTNIPGCAFQYQDWRVPEGSYQAIYGQNPGVPDEVWCQSDLSIAEAAENLDYMLFGWFPPPTGPTESYAYTDAILIDGISTSDCTDRTSGESLTMHGAIITDWSQSGVHDAFARASAFWLSDSAGDLETLMVTSDYHPACGGNDALWLYFGEPWFTPMGRDLECSTTTTSP